MTLRTRQIIVAVGLVAIAAWIALTWTGSTASPEPSFGSSPTGAIGSAPVTFEPSGDASAEP